MHDPRFPALERPLVLLAWLSIAACGGVDAGSGSVDAGSGGADAGSGGADVVPDGDGSVLAAEATFQGIQVALSGDGSRAVVSQQSCGDAAHSCSWNTGVFLRSGTTWSNEATLPYCQGSGAVALSADGSRALDSCLFNGGFGRVFLRTATAWGEEATLAGGYGASVALSADGSRALLGTPDVGARVLLRTGTTWEEEATLLVPGTAAGNPDSVVALSSDGSRALVGLVADTSAGETAGSTRVFLRTGTTWTEEATLLAPWSGWSAALSSDGSRALVGVQVFLREGTTWTKEGPRLRLDGPGPGALSADGTRAIVGVGGGVGDNTRVFLRVGTAWTHEETLLTATGAASVALSADGSRALVGTGFSGASVFLLPAR